MPTATLSSTEFSEQFGTGAVAGMVPLNLAAELLGVSRSTLLTMEHASIMKVLGKTETVGVDANWLRAEMVTRRQRNADLEKLTPDGVRNFLEQRLACSGFGHGDVRMVEYSADLMVPFGLQHHLSQHRKRMGEMLGQVSTETYNTDHIILSAVVVNKSGENRGRPAGGFWNLVSSLGFHFNDDEESYAFWREQIILIREYIARKVVCSCEKCVLPEFLKRPQPPAQAPLPAFVGTLEFNDEGYAPFLIDKLQMLPQGVAITGSYQADADSIKCRMSAVALKAGVDPHTRKQIYQTGSVALFDESSGEVLPEHTALRFTMDDGAEGRHLSGVWTDVESGTTYGFAGDLDAIKPL